jgi:molybdenum cofactor cytidylyltransferase
VIFGPTPLALAEGAVLAHAWRHGKTVFKKGRVLSRDDVEALRAAGVDSVIAARIEPDDMAEDAAADQVARAVMGQGLAPSAAFTGRCNLIAQRRGLLVVDRARVDRLNAIDEAITLATLAPHEIVEPRQMAATIKVIPFAAPRAAVAACVALAAGGPLLEVVPFQARRVGLVQTTLPGLKPAILDKTMEALDRRLAALDCPPAVERRVPHDEAAVAGALRALHNCDILLVSGASAIVDRRDVVPAGIVAAGGELLHFGMPVDPGNLILLARWGERPVLGLPGCARSPKVNGFDWVLERLVAGLAVTPADIQAMGVGGLLKETGQRPLPRAQAVEPAEAAPGPQRQPRIAALVLAAGQARRMGSNKLVAELGGKPLVRHVVEAALASQAASVTVVSGHEPDRLAEALAGTGVRIVHNPDYASGLSTSLQRGLAALPADVDGALVLLGDMPRVSTAAIDRLIAAFSPLEGRALCVPTWQGKRGNPLLFAKRYFAEVQAIDGDQGARLLLSEHPDAVAEVAMPDDAVLTDVDTPEALAALRER